MGDVTRLLQAFRIDGTPSEELVDAIYEELRYIARSQFAHEKPGQTLQPTALVHEAYQRLFRSTDRSFQNRKQFFAAAAETMRRILVDRSRRQVAQKRGGGMVKCELTEFSIAAPGTPQEIVALNEALQGLHETDSLAAELVKLRFFVGLTIEEAAEALGISVRSCNRSWKFARAWLYEEMSQSEDGK